MGTLIEWLDQKLYPEYQSNWDDILFRKHILKHLQKAPLDVLDLGAGAGIVEQMNFKGIARRMSGVDPDTRVVDNSYLDEGKVGVGEDVPYPKESFDLIFADNVLEHLPQPEKVFAEINRLLRPGGVFLAKTPNKWHYMPMIARLTPHRFHQWVNKWRGRGGEDVFPTCYLANATGDIRCLADGAGLSVRNIKLIEGRPEYLRMMSITYVLGWLYEKLVNSLSILKRFRILLITELQKPTN